MGIRTKLTVSALVAGAALAAAIPAQAQSNSQSRDRYEQRNDRWDDRRDDRYDKRWDARGQANALNVQIRQLEQRVQRFDSRDRISEREATALRRQVYNLRQQYRDFSRNGLTQREFQVLQSRIQQVHQRLQFDRRDNDGRRW